MEEASSFRLGMRKLAGGVCVMTTRAPDGDRCGMTVTAVCSLTAEPPTLLACVNRRTRLGEVIPSVDTFAVNVLTTGHRRIAEAFAGMVPGVRGGDRFSFGRWHEDATGVPVLEDAIACFVCGLEEIIGRSTHLLLIGRVVDVRVADREAPPLVYFSRRFGQVSPHPPPALELPR